MELERQLKEEAALQRLEEAGRGERVVGAARGGW
jgi:hypothetical protein